MFTHKHSHVHTYSKQCIDASASRCSRSCIAKLLFNVTNSNLLPNIHSNWIYIIQYNSIHHVSSPSFFPPSVIQKKKRYCSVYGVTEPAAGVCLAISLSIVTLWFDLLAIWKATLGFHFKFLFYCNFFHPAKWNGKWRRNKNAWRKKDESLQRSERLVLRDIVRVFTCSCVWPNHGYVWAIVCVCRSKGVCVHTKGVLQNCVYV